ncbi:MAG: hypothetical protein AB7S72_15160 [Draconibacterium sp.]
MRLNFTLLFLLIAMCITAQQTEFVLQGKITDGEQNPVADAYIVNIRNSSRFFSATNGVFEMKVQPGDTLLISHISFQRKIVTVFELLKNPVISLEGDMVNMKPIDVKGSRETDYETAKKNINAVTFDAKPRISDGFSHSEQVSQMIKSENRVMRTEASSVSIASFSPSQVIGKLSEKRKKRKEASLYESTRKLPKEEEKVDDNTP